MLNRIRKNDLVMVISGKDKGAQGRVISVDPKSSRVKVRGVCLLARHKKARSPKDQGGIVREESFIHSSKVMPVCPITGKPVRVRTKITPEGKKIRVSHRSGEAL